MDSFAEIWQLVQQELKNQVTEVAYNVWLSPLEFVKFENDTVYLSISEFKKNIIADKFMNTFTGAFEAILGFPIPQKDIDPNTPIDPSGSLELAAGTKRGDKVIALITAVVEKIGGGGINSEMMKNTAFQIPIRCFMTMSGGVVNEEMCEGICDFLNGKPLPKSLGKILKNVPSAISKIPDMIKSM